MKLLTINDMIKITIEVFETYGEHVALSLMSGELPTSTFIIHRTGTEDNDWLVKIRFKNTMTISVFHCEVYLDDILHFCKLCKMYLVTSELFKIAVSFSMLHPLYQTQYMNFVTDVNTDYNSMMVGASTATYRFLLQQYDFTEDIEHVFLEILYYRSMSLVNQFYRFPDHISPYELEQSLLSKYKEYMLKYHRKAYNSAKRFKAYNNLLDEDGFIRMERKN